ncbi:FkbM family methyltransferase [Sphingobium boeckii]|uniref:FkbM family methyltransferase n=1 Tax=Sphingobium boeckii TaxID=1082345 RepID=A0A7W9EFC7_9SPHN|nr:FkbM family methyltransferase [Sphingobium boeckii]MBB5687107.1 FkbM family methyltransferase [Sphingobium boeckii]
MLREKLIGSLFENHIIGTRNFFDLVKLAAVRSEGIGDAYNNQLASKLVTAIAKPGSTFLDIGAHIGSVVSAALRRKSLNVIAVEAIPAKAERLTKKFPMVEVHCCALSDTDGEASFFINLNASGFSSLARNGTNVQEIKVSLKRLDQIVSADDVDMIKIDVEGAELGVLKGGEHLLKRCRPTVMFESGPEEVLGFTNVAMWSWLNEHDYAVFAPDRLGHTGPPMGLDVFLDSHSYPRRTTNYFAVHESRIEKIRVLASNPL